MGTHMGTQRLQLDVPDISCGGCAGSVTKAIKVCDVNAKVTVSVSDRRVIVETTETREGIVLSLAAAGYHVA